MRPNRVANRIDVLMDQKPADERAAHDLFHTELLNLSDQRLAPAPLAWRRCVRP